MQSEYSGLAGASRESIRPRKNHLKAARNSQIRQDAEKQPGEHKRRRAFLRKKSRAISSAAQCDRSGKYYAVEHRLNLAIGHRVKNADRLFNETLKSEIFFGALPLCRIKISRLPVQVSGCGFDAHKTGHGSVDTQIFLHGPSDHSQIHANSIRTCCAAVVADLGPDVRADRRRGHFRCCSSVNPHFSRKIRT
jgi:hypothetical protein